MESPRKFNDCYFYYYSTCIKGDDCDFRHEPSALGCETMCTAWQQGKCLDKRCKLRHMELRKNRKQIPCYWENQPGGCRKIHCPFMHKNPDARTDGIAPSQPAPSALSKLLCAGEAGAEVLGGGVPVVTPAPVATPVPAPVPLLWQQQSQVVLDSAILGVQLSAGGELRRVLTPHAHAPHAPHAPHAQHAPHGPHAQHAHPHAAPNPYASLPVDPLVVNFDEESDNESAPSSTPTKGISSDEMQTIARTKSQELLLLEKIQAEAAAFYSYDALQPAEQNERKMVRSNLNNKYDRLSLEEISGKKQTGNERRNSLDFKVLSLEEIRARKKEAIIHTTPITLNLSRKRKLSTQETITTSGNKIIKVVRSNSIVYKKVDRNASPATSQAKVDNKPPEDENSRKRTLSELSDMCEIQDDELIDNCYEFKRVKIGEQTAKPRLIRNRLSSTNKSCDEVKETLYSKLDDSDSEVQIVSVEVSEEHIDLATDVEVIDVDSTKLGESIDVVDLSDDFDECDVTVTDLDIDLDKNVPDIVASCQKSNKIDNSDKILINDIDALLSDEL